MLVAGIMSGTSVDGIDVVLVNIQGEGFEQTVRIEGFQEVPFPAGIRKEVLAISNTRTHTANISQLNFLLGTLFGEAVVETCKCTGIPIEKIELVGSHGQTIYHQAEGSDLSGREVRSTMQIGEAACIAHILKTPVVADFRPADMAAGGQGAPLVPFVDYLLFRHQTDNRVALNIGGIANLTAIPAYSGAESVIAFDTGPGNMVIDALVEYSTKGARSYDCNGEMASRGKVNEPLLAELLADQYYRQPAPKSTGREQYGSAYVAKLLDQDITPESLIATAARLTSQTIVLGIERLVLPIMPVNQLIVSGGGLHNPVIMQDIQKGLPATEVLTSSDFGIEGDAKEALAFAVFAYETYHGRPSNLPSATGASCSKILGKISLPGD